MKYIIHKIYQKLLGFFRIKEKAPINKTEDNSAYLSFKLVNDNSLEILCQLPNISQLSADSIVSLAENYADLLVRVNNGLLKKDIVKIIQNTYDNRPEIEYKLLADNILVFCDLLQTEYEKQASAQSNKPIIRPTAVFRHELSK